MKRILLLLILLAPSVRAQTITLGPITKLAYCVGDTMTVSYTASGSFDAGSNFIAQLSDGAGSFASFKIVGTSDSESGTFAIVLTSAGSHFRVRVASTSPYIISPSDLGDILVSSYPTPTPSLKKWGVARFTHAQCNCYFAGGLMGDPIILKDYGDEPSGSTYSWTFNEDASPQTSTEASPTVTYPEAGTKDGILTVTSPAGCSTTASFAFKVLSCEPIIPANVHIVTTTETGDDSVVWVKAGGNYTTVGDSQTVWAEPGAVITVSSSETGIGNYSTYYLKSGTSFTLSSLEAFPTILLNTGNDLNIGFDNGDTFYCNNLQFDYSQVQSSVVENSAPTFSLIQSGDHLFANTEETPAEIRIMNILGAEVLSQHGTGALDVDLSPLPAGVYFAMVQSGDAREVRKIAVVH